MRRLVFGMFLVAFGLFMMYFEPPDYSLYQVGLLLVGLGIAAHGAFSKRVY